MHIFIHLFLVLLPDRVVWMTRVLFSMEMFVTNTR